MKIITNAATPRKITFTFEDGVEPIQFDADRVHTAQHQNAEMHGWTARLRDAAAIARKQADGTVINVTEKMRAARVQELVTHYHGGSAEWNIKASAAPRINPAIEAMARRLGVSYEDACAKGVDEMLNELMGIGQPA